MIPKIFCFIKRFYRYFPIIKYLIHYVKKNIIFLPQFLRGVCNFSNYLQVNLLSAFFSEKYEESFVF